MAIDVGALRHPKEKTYGMGVNLVGGLTYASFALFTLGAGPLGMFLMSWLSEQFFRASVFGNAVKVSEKQYPQIHQMVLKGVADFGLAKVPDTFVFNADGMVNAFAVKFLKKKYVLLTAPSVELLLERGHPLELAAVVGHELGHHAAGHTGYWKGQFSFWTNMFLPTLASAYSRACEHTCDRLGAAFAGEPKAMQTALVAIASGSRAAPLNLEAFVAQEAEVPQLVAFLQEILSSHPRTTLRVRALQEATDSGLLPKRKMNFGGTQRLAAPGRGTGAVARPGGEATPALAAPQEAPLMAAPVASIPAAPMPLAGDRPRPPQAPSTQELPQRPEPPATPVPPQAHQAPPAAPQPPAAQQAPRPATQVPRPPDLERAPRPEPLAMANPFAEEGPSQVAHAFHQEASQPHATEASAQEAWPASPPEAFGAEDAQSAPSQDATGGEPKVVSWTSATGELFERVEASGPPPSSTSGTWDSR